MKKNFVLFIAFFVFGINNISNSQYKIILESDINLKKTIVNYSEKNIISVNMNRYDIDSGALNPEFEKISRRIFEIDKNIFTEIIFYPNFSRTVVTFNPSKNVTDISIYYSDNTLTSRVVTNYETGDKVQDKIYYFGSSMTFKTKNIYSSGKIVRQDNVDSLDNILNYSKLYYDDSGNLIEEDKFNANDSLDIVYQYSYDKSGNCTEEIINYPSINYTSKIVNVFNDKGNKTESTSYGIGGKITTTDKYKYNDMGLLTEESSNSFDNKIIKKSEYKYDDRGNKTEWKFKDFNDDIEYLYKYEYQ